MDSALDGDMLGICSLQPISAPHADTLTIENKKVLTFINNTFDDIHAALNSWPHTEIKVVLNRVSKLEHKQTIGVAARVDDQLKSTREEGLSREMKFSWPGDTAQEAWRFGMRSLHNLTSSFGTMAILFPRLDSSDFTYH